MLQEAKETEQIIGLIFEKLITYVSQSNGVGAGAGLFFLAKTGAQSRNAININMRHYSQTMPLLSHSTPSQPPPGSDHLRFP
jgi:hypothetical protein